ncbi:peroxiredoxin [Parasulfitobacter algicola]|uniref:Peroxiredoxin n=1 Tax=Parasulfitobacter algicola TaxID=2614809 RepID=A0ABX2IZN0_9RHOB|nr:peroxiredoxin [Sulfitobacter algicola]NSX56737.1 peroxiredoxin [Sulfitobacter algicola]
MKTPLEKIDWSELPEPEDNGAADHLTGTMLPQMQLSSTSGVMIDLSHLSGITVVYAYPRTGQPDQPLPDGWDMIPGARGCTPQSCAFRDHFAELKALGVDHLFGLSTQDTAYQSEAAARLHLPFPLLSDAKLALTKALNLPTFQAAGMTLLHRLTLIVRDGVIIKSFYPVFPPDQNATDVINWLKSGASTDR